jgi:hypothetical protein
MGTAGREQLTCNLPADLSPAGTAAIYYRIGTQPPVQVTASCFSSTTQPQSLVLWFYDPSVQPLSFLMYLGIDKIYIGPGEYRGNVNDILVGLGVVTGEGSSLTWTAGPDTASDLTTYVAPQNALIGTFSAQGLVPGPVLGPPDNPLPLDQPPLEILFCYFTGDGA